MRRMMHGRLAFGYARSGTRDGEPSTALVRGVHSQAHRIASPLPCCGPADGARPSPTTPGSPSMPDTTQRDIYARTPDGATQLAASTDRWHLFDDHVHLAPHRAGDPRLRRFDAELMPFVDSLDHGALVVIDMQNDFCSPGGWTDASGLDYRACRAAIPGVRRAVEAAHAYGMWVVWVYWSNRPDLRNLGAPTLYAFKHRPTRTGSASRSGRGACSPRARGTPRWWTSSSRSCATRTCTSRRCG